jgi:serine/threonine protein kinase
MHTPTVPGYKPLRYLGGGPLFQVWEARPEDDVVPVALKLPRPESADDPAVLALLRREARAGLAVRHPRLVRVLRSHVFTAPPFVVCELIPGEPLRDRLRRSGRLGVRAAVWAARQAAEAVAALHKAGLVHADVKPGNILVAAGGETTLIDLAFAHRPGENRELLKSGFVMGTANYLAPELCAKPPREGPAADVFALGVTLFECLTGQLPYPGGSAGEVIRRRRTDEPRDLTDVPGEWPDRVVEAARGMLAVDPRDRPTAARVVRELVRIEVDLIRSAASRRRVRAWAERSPAGRG